MKRISLTLFIAAIALVLAGTMTNAVADPRGGPPGLRNKGGVPPGLQKKGGIPPGQAKKHGKKYGKKKGEYRRYHREETERDRDRRVTTSTREGTSGSTSTPTSRTRTRQDRQDSETRQDTRQPDITRDSPHKPTTTTTTTRTRTDRQRTTTSPAVIPEERKLSRANQRRHDRLRLRVSELDRVTRKPAARERVMVRIYEQYKVPRSKVKAQLRENPDVGLGGLYVAHTIARASRDPVERILNEHRSGRTWGHIAASRKVSVANTTARAASATTLANRAVRQQQAAVRR